MPRTRTTASSRPRRGLDPRPLPRRRAQGRAVRRTRPRSRPRSASAPLKAMAVIDEVVYEDEAETHAAFPTTAARLGALICEPRAARAARRDALVAQRYAKFRAMGRYRELDAPARAAARRGRGARRDQAAPGEARHDAVQARRVPRPRCCAASARARGPRARAVSARAADAAARERARARAERQGGARRGPRRWRGARADARARDRHDDAPRAPVAARRACARSTSPRARRSRASCSRARSRSSAGAARPSTSRTASCTRTRGTGCARSRPPRRRVHADAHPRRQRGRLHELPRHGRRALRRARRAQRARRLPHLRLLQRRRADARTIARCAPRKVAEVCIATRPTASRLPCTTSRTTASSRLSAAART